MNVSRSKIAILRYRFIGDTLLTIPFLRVLRQHNPHCEIVLYLSPDTVALLEGCPYIDRIVAFDPKTMGFFKALACLKQEQFDRIYVLKRSFSSALLAFLAGIPERIGYASENRNFLLTQAVTYRSYLQHEAACHLDLITPFLHTTLIESEKEKHLYLEHWQTESDLARVKEDYALTFPYIILHPTSSNALKHWGDTAYTQLIQSLLSHFPEHHLVFLGTHEDKQGYQKLLRTLQKDLGGSPSLERLHNWAGTTELKEAMALVYHAQLLVGNDSGLAHIASAMNTATVTLFGPSDPNQWRALGENHTVVTAPLLTCRPCKLKVNCNNTFECFTEIRPKDVLSACHSVLTH
jgi:heptosyltransferase II